MELFAVLVTKLLGNSLMLSIVQPQKSWTHDVMTGRILLCFTHRCTLVKAYDSVFWSNISSFTPRVNFLCFLNFYLKKFFRKSFILCCVHVDISSCLQYATMPIFLISSKIPRSKILESVDMKLFTALE